MNTAAVRPGPAALLLVGLTGDCRRVANSSTRPVGWTTAFNLQSAGDDAVLSGLQVERGYSRRR